MSSYGVFVYVENDGWRRPKSKAEIKRTIPERITLEGTSPFDSTLANGVVAYLTDLPDGKYDIVGPDPYSKRTFYGSIIKAENGQVYVK